MKRNSAIAITIATAAVIGFSVFAINASQGSAAGSAMGASPSRPVRGAPGAPGGKAPPGGMPGPGSQAASGPKAVKASAAVVKTLRPYIDAGGDVEASVSMSIYPEIGGRLVDMKIAVGDSVSKGQSIGSVDPSKPGSNYAVSSIASPIGGTITSVLVNVGETVTTATPIAKVGVIDDLGIGINLPERYSARARKGMGATISFEAMPGERFPATVTRVSPVLDSTSRTRAITLSLNRRDERVAAGMYANVRLYTSPLADRVVIPESAVVARDEESFVFVVAQRDGKTVAERRTVKTGTGVDEDIEVVEGVAEGERVVSEGQDLLSDGAEVSEIEGAAK